MRKKFVKSLFELLKKGFYFQKSFCNIVYNLFQGAKKMKKMLVILLTLALVLSLVACGQSAEIKPVTMKIGMLKGPTGMGMAKMLEEGYVLDKTSKQRF